MPMKRIFTLITLISLAITIQAQDTIALSDYAVQVAGTSTLHAWTVDVNNARGNLVLNDQGVPTSVHVEFEVESMVSGRGPVMDGKVKKALKAETHPWIYFDSSQISSVDGSLKVMGQLEVGGISRSIELTVNPNGDNYSTNSDISFSQFDIVPPSAMFGQIKCGDDLSITLEVTFSK